MNKTTDAFRRLWLAPTGHYIDDLLWSAVITASRAEPGFALAQRDAAWQAYINYDYGGDEDLLALLNIIHGGADAGIDSDKMSELIRFHPTIDGIVAAVNDAMDRVACPAELKT